MSGRTYFDICPRCDNEHLDVYSDEESKHEACLDCGFRYSHEVSQLTLEEVNEERERNGLKVLEKLEEKNLITGRDLL